MLLGTMPKTLMMNAAMNMQFALIALHTTKDVKIVAGCLGPVC